LASTAAKPQRTRIMALIPRTMLTDMAASMKVQE
jgi:hypothetical protein